MPAGAAAPAAEGSSVTLRVRRERGPGGEARLVLEGRLDADSVGPIWRDALDFVREAGAGPLRVDASGIGYCDGAGAALLDALRGASEAAGGRFRVEGLRDDLQQLVELVAPARTGASAAAAKARVPLLGRLGRGALELLEGQRRLLAFVGELWLDLGSVLRHPSQLRVGDTVAVAERAGIGAIPIVVGVGFLLGLILAFQGAIPMKRFAAEIFVADLLGLSMLRELGPLMASILLTARSGSAFAAEIGTMKVNEEIDALVTMGLEPVRFLVLPRVVAAVLVVPALAMLTSLSGLLGGLVVYRSLGFPTVTFVQRIQEMVTAGDVLGGLVKAMVFGVIVAAVGCLRGIQAGQGPEAVGVSTTSAVVSGIVGIAVADGLFAIVFYFLGI
jgi:phospholipid/cholesterol/gamma-HCH transport system permease protein